MLAQLNLFTGNTKTCACAITHTLCDERCSSIAKSVHGFGPNQLAVNERRWRRLTRAQKKVVSRLFDGLTNRQIAHSLEITPKTVKNHLNMIYRKFQVLDRFELSQILKKEVQP
jgi:DNA-binding CsgD family transcriptional regulator